MRRRGRSELLGQRCSSGHEVFQPCAFHTGIVCFHIIRTQLRQRWQLLPFRSPQESIPCDWFLEPLPHTPPPSPAPTMLSGAVPLGGVSLCGSALPVAVRCWVRAAPCHPRTTAPPADEVCVRPLKSIMHLVHGTPSPAPLTLQLPSQGGLLLPGPGLPSGSHH